MGSCFSCFPCYDYFSSTTEAFGEPRLSGGCVVDAFTCKACILKQENAGLAGREAPPLAPWRAALDSEAPRPGASAPYERGADPGGRWVLVWIRFYFSAPNSTDQNTDLSRASVWARAGPRVTWEPGRTEPRAGGLAGAGWGGTSPCNFQGFDLLPHSRINYSLRCRERREGK